MNAVYMQDILKAYKREFNKLYEKLCWQEANAFRDNVFWHKGDKKAAIKEPSEYEIYFHNLKKAVSAAQTVINSQLKEIQPDIDDTVNWGNNEDEYGEYVDDLVENAHDIFELRCKANGTCLAYI